MSHRLPSLRFSQRIALSFALVLLIVGALIAVNTFTSGKQAAAMDRMERAQDFAHRADHLKYLSADFNGWQTAYSLDVALGTPNATTDDAPSRAAFLEAVDAFTDGLSEVDQAASSPAARAAVEQARKDFKQFMVHDAEIIELYDRGDDTSAAAANELILGTEIELFASIAEQADVIVAAATDEFAAAEDAAHAAQHTAQFAMWTGGLLAMVFCIGLGALLTRSITRPTRRLRDRLEALAEGDLASPVPGAGTTDEIGEMATALDTATSNLRGLMVAVTSSADAVAASSEELSATSQQIAASAEETSVQATVVSGAADEVSRNMQTVAAGAEEMGASIREIAGSANDAARVATEAVGIVERTNESVGKLGTSSQEIGNVVKVITSIAEQTNLLALNATIEAARAGEAGKGFAVVANEVKELAQETARATEDIARRVAAIQADTGGAVDAIGEIATIITSINDYQLTIASAVEEQTATTNEMARNVDDASSGAGSIADNISGVSQAAESTTEALSQSLIAVDELARLASDLRQSVSLFRT